MLFPMAAQAQTPSEYRSPTIHETLRFLEKSNQDIATFTKTRKFLKMNYDSLVYAVDRMKQNGNVGFFDRMKLKSMLKESEDIANQIVKIDNLVKAHEEANRQKTRGLIELMEKEIADTLNVLIFRHHGTDTGLAESITKLTGMLAEKEALQIYKLKKFLMPVTEIRIQRDDEAEILYQKSDYLLDQTERLADYTIELDRITVFLMEEDKTRKRIYKLSELIKNDPKNRQKLLSYFPDSILAFHRLPLSKTLVTPFDDYETLIKRLLLEKDAALSRIQLYREESADIREIADYKSKMWNR
jgi:hypothetical protein